MRGCVCAGAAAWAYGWVGVGGGCSWGICVGVWGEGAAAGAYAWGCEYADPFSSMRTHAIVV